MAHPSGLSFLGFGTSFGSIPKAGWGKLICNCGFLQILFYLHLILTLTLDLFLIHVIC